MCIYAFGYSVLISGHGLVEVQYQVAHERPESDLVTGKSRLGPSFTRASDFECVGWTLGEPCAGFLDKSHELTSLVIVRRTGQYPSKDPIDLQVVPLGGLLDEVLGQASRGLDLLDIVHQLERLERCVASFTPRAKRLAVGGIEVRHKGYRCGPFDIGVETSAVEILAMLLDVVARVGISVTDRFPNIGRLVSAKARAAEFAIEDSADGQRIVADLFGIEPNAGPSGQIPILWVARQGLLVQGGIPAEGLGHDELLEEGFDVPAVAAETMGQIIEQLRVARRSPLRAEIIGGLDQADSEDLLPEAIDGHTGCQGILVRDDPASKLQAA